MALFNFSSPTDKAFQDKVLRKLDNLSAGIDTMYSLISQVKTQGARLMSKIQDFQDHMNAFFDRQDVAVAGLVDDVAGLKDEIVKLKDLLGADVSPEVAAVLDAVEARAGSMTDKIETLDNATPPVVPTV